MTKARREPSVAFQILRGVLIALILILSLMLLALMIVPRVTARSWSGSTIVEQDEAQLAGCLQEFHQDCGRYPTTSEGLNALLPAPGALTAEW